MTPVSENNEEPEEKSQGRGRRTNSKVRAQNRLKETVDIAVEPELSGKEALRKYMKERLNL